MTPTAMATLEAYGMPQTGKRYTRAEKETYERLGWLFTVVTFFGDPDEMFVLTGAVPSLLPIVGWIPAKISLKNPYWQGYGE